VVAVVVSVLLLLLLLVVVMVVVVVAAAGSWCCVRSVGAFRGRRRRNRIFVIPPPTGAPRTNMWLQIERLGALLLVGQQAVARAAPAAAGRVRQVVVKVHAVELSCNAAEHVRAANVRLTQPASAHTPHDAPALIEARRP
jgi:hypothetical protein